MNAQQFFGLAVGATFLPGSTHTATAQMRNPASLPFTYHAVLYLGLYEGDQVVSSAQDFSQEAGETKAISFPITMPNVQDVTYLVYIDVYCEDELIAAYQGVEDVRVYLQPQIELINITWA